MTVLGVIICGRQQCECNTVAICSGQWGKKDIIEDRDLERNCLYFFLSFDTSFSESMMCQCMCNTQSFIISILLWTIV